MAITWYSAITKYPLTWTNPTPTPPTIIPTYENHSHYKNLLAIAFKMRCRMPFYIFPFFFRFPYFSANPETEIRIFGYRWNPWVKPDPQVPCRRP